MPDEIPQSTSGKLLAELQTLAERSERLRIEARKNAEEAIFIIDKMAMIQRRMIEEEAGRIEEPNPSTPLAGPWIYP